MPLDKETENLTKEATTSEKIRLMENKNKIQNDISQNNHDLAEMTEMAAKETGHTLEILIEIIDALNAENIEKQAEIKLLKEQIKMFNNSEPKPSSERSNLEDLPWSNRLEQLAFDNSKPLIAESKAP